MESLIRPTPRKAEAHWHHSTITQVVAAAQKPEPRVIVRVVKRVTFHVEPIPFAHVAPVASRIEPAVPNCAVGRTRRRPLLTEQSDDAALRHLASVCEASESPEFTPTHEG